MLQMFVLALSLYNTWNRGVFLLCKITNLLIYSIIHKMRYKNTTKPRSIFHQLSWKNFTTTQMTIITPIQKKIWKDSPTSEAISFKKANTRRIITIKPPQPNLPFFIPFTTFLFSYAINNSSIKSFHHQILRFFKFCDLIFFDSYSVYQ